jgi:hypothetical protein
MAYHTSLGSVELALLHEDADMVPLKQEESVYLSFDVPELEEGWVREFILRTRGWWGAVDPGSYGRMAGGVKGLQFPKVVSTSGNPFRSEFTVSLSVPDKRWITAGIYDVQGRRLRTVEDRPFEAGEHWMGWDGRTDSGESAVPGVYFLRIAANGRKVYHDKVVKVP